MVRPQRRRSDLISVCCSCSCAPFLSFLPLSFSFFPSPFPSCPSLSFSFPYFPFLPVPSPSFPFLSVPFLSFPFPLVVVVVVVVWAILGPGRFCLCSFGEKSFRHRLVSTVSGWWVHHCCGGWPVVIQPKYAKHARPPLAEGQRYQIKFFSSAAPSWIGVGAGVWVVCKYVGDGIP